MTLFLVLNTIHGYMSWAFKNFKTELGFVQLDILQKISRWFKSETAFHTILI